MICFYNFNGQICTRPNEFCEDHERCLIRQRSVGSQNDILPSRPMLQNIIQIAKGIESSGFSSIRESLQQVEVIGKLLPWDQWEPVSREQQARNMGKFLGDIAQAANIPPDHVLCVGGEAPTSTAKTSNTERTAK